MSINKQSVRYLASGGRKDLVDRITIIQQTDP